ncbi:Rho GTPase activation protein [Phellopilus nigrolimitatus]|nr:Rho GTPase activation protein [Phellopilus nigrolimitatus]
MSSRRSSPSPVMPQGGPSRQKGSLSPSGGSHTYRQPYPAVAAADPYLWEQDNLHRRPMQQEPSSSRGFDSRYPDFPQVYSHSQAHAAPSPSHTKWALGTPTRMSRLSQYRNYLPISLPSREHAHRIDSNEEPQPPASTAHSPTSINFPLPMALQRLKEADLETFKLARACGMTPDPVRISRPRKSFLVDEREAAGRRTLMENSKSTVLHRDDSSRSVSLEHSVAGSRAHTKKKGDSSTRAHSRPRPLSPAHAINRDRTGSPSPPSSSQSTPPLLTKSDFPRPNKNRLPPPRLVQRHRATWRVPALIDVDRLLHAHGVDVQVEDVRVQMERTGDSDGLSFQEMTESWNDSEKGAGWRKPMAMVDPLSLTRMYASCVSSMAGYQHDLPIVVYACVEELYRTGMTVPGLFRSPPCRSRHSELIDLFDRGPTFGRSLTLAKETTADIGALLRSYIDRMPRAVWHEALFDAMWKLCVNPSMLREMQFEEETERDETNARTSAANQRSGKGKSRDSRPASFAMPKRKDSFGADLHTTARVRPVSLSAADSLSGSLSSSALSAGLTDADIMLERPQLEVARVLFRLLPRAQLALLAYLCAFFTQLPLSPQNQLGIEDIAGLFAAPLFLGKPHTGGVPVTGATWQARKEDARTMMAWILRRWTHISEGLFDVSNDIDDDEDMKGEIEDNAASASSSDSESVYSQLSMCAWPAAGSSSHDQLDPSGFDLSTSPTFSTTSLSASVLTADLRPTLRERGKDGVHEDSEQIGDILKWKSVVEKDIDELRRELVDVKARLDGDWDRLPISRQRDGC